jgi:carbon storage regulator
MLVLSRGKNQSVVCGGPCEVYVIAIRRGVVRLGFRADKAVAIHRREVHEAIQRGEREKPEAA